MVLLKYYLSVSLWLILVKGKFDKRVWDKLVCWWLGDSFCCFCISFFKFLFFFCFWCLYLFLFYFWWCLFLHFCSFIFIVVIVGVAAVGARQLNTILCFFKMFTYFFFSQSRGMPAWCVTKWWGICPISKITSNLKGIFSAPPHSSGLLLLQSMLPLVSNSFINFILNGYSIIL